MNFLELINKCLLELNYRPVNSYSELVKNDHKKIIINLNVVNKEICAIEDWDFLVRKTNVEIPANIDYIPKTFNGRILYLLIDGQKFKYEHDLEPFINGKPKDNTYSYYQDKILVSKSSKIRNADIFYYTSNCVADSNGDEQTDFVNPTDESLIPMPFAQQLLVYGTCLRLKANPSYIRFSYWMSMYKEALANLKSTNSIYAKQGPTVKLFRK